MTKTLPTLDLTPYADGTGTYNVFTVLNAAKPIADKTMTRSEWNMLRTNALSGDHDYFWSVIESHFEVIK